MDPALISVAIALLLGTGLLVVAVAVAMAAMHPTSPAPLEPVATGLAHPLPTPTR